MFVPSAGMHLGSGFFVTYYLNDAAKLAKPRTCFRRQFTLWGATKAGAHMQEGTRAATGRVEALLWMTSDQAVSHAGDPRIQSAGSPAGRLRAAHNGRERLVFFWRCLVTGILTFSVRPSVHARAQSVFFSGCAMV